MRDYYKPLYLEMVTNWFLICAASVYFTYQANTNNFTHAHDKHTLLL